MGKCIVCGKSTGLFSKDKICKKCKEYHVLKIKSCIEFRRYCCHLRGESERRFGRNTLIFSISVRDNSAFKTGEE